MTKSGLSSLVVYAIECGCPFEAHSGSSSKSSIPVVEVAVALDSLQAGTSSLLGYDVPYGLAVIRANPLCLR